MLFNSFQFLVFFPIVVFIYFLVPKKARHIWLLISSYYFYMSWNAKYAILIGISTVITWICGLWIQKCAKKRGKQAVIAVGFLSNLGILFFFKYFDFALENLNRILQTAGIQAVKAPFSLLLPVGISFYTFQALGYIVDVYRKEITPEKNLLKYALFVSFFPQLVAGPIERSGTLLKQIREVETFHLFQYDRVISGSIQMIVGLFQKMVIADRLALFVDSVFENVHACGTVELVLGVFAFAFQLYCDFAGYSAVAVGAARVMGFELMENFNAPYLADSIQDFWHRWHISLSTWFRDYVYIPLGGNRKGRFQKYRNLMLTFLVSGLWHGARWTYVVWGGLHGIYQIVGDILKPLKEACLKRWNVKTDNFSYPLGKIAVTFCLQSFTLIFFRALSIKDAFYYIKRMFTRWNPWVLFDQSLYTWGLDKIEFHVLVVSLFFLFLMDLLKYVKKITLSEFLMEQNWWFRFAVTAGMILAILIYGQYGGQFDSAQFLYFQF